MYMIQVSNVLDTEFWCIGYRVMVYWIQGYGVFDTGLWCKTEYQIDFVLLPCISVYSMLSG